MKTVYVLIDSDRHRDDNITVYESKKDAIINADKLINKWSKIYGQPTFELNEKDKIFKSWVDDNYSICIDTVYYFEEGEQ